MWKCKSRIQWQSMAELNTKFFHLSTVVRRRRNSIESLKTEDGRWITSRDDLGNHFISSFSQLYTSSSPSLGPEIASLIPPLVTEDENFLLCRVPDEREIWLAVRSLGATKAPGPDGITALFFHSFWNIVKLDVIEAVQKFLSLGFLFKSLNHSNLVLIPKKANPTLVSHFRPISLCNVLYKVLPKILAN